MTRQQVAKLLCKADRGGRETDIAQMNEHLSDLSKLLKGPKCADVLKALLASLLLVLLPACGMIPTEMRAPLDQAIKDNGAGNYYLACQLGKDDRQVLGIRGTMACTADTLQLKGCHKKGLAFEGTK